MSGCVVFAKLKIGVLHHLAAHCTESLRANPTFCPFGIYGKADLLLTKLRLYIQRA